MEWYIDLSQNQTYTVISGMGGGGVVYQPHDPRSLEAWARISGNDPTQWELSVLRRMNLSWVAAKTAADNKQGGSDRQYQALGDYCNGEKIDECRAMFGETLATICATCPN